MKSWFIKKDRLLAGTILAGASVVGLASPAAAQDAAAAAAEEEVIIITGSRIARQDLLANSPIVTVTQEDMQATGSVTVDTLLNDMPQFVPSVNFTSNNPSNGGQANVELRGLGPERTLVLMDGRRITPSNASPTVDLNIIPPALVESVEVVTGGASAAYGSEAIAGVVNFKIRDDFEGVQIDGQYGETFERDGGNDSIMLTVGGNFDGGRGNAVLSFGYANRSAILNADRDFSAISGASGTSPLGSTAAFATNAYTYDDVNAYLASVSAAAFPTDADSSTSTPAGGDAFTGNIGFNDDGSLFFYTGRRNYGGPTTIDYTGFQPNFSYNTGALNYMTLPLTRYNIFGRVTYELTPHAEVYGQFASTQYEASQRLAPTPAAGNPTVGGTGFLVPATNPFIPADLAGLLAQRPDPTAPFLLNKRFTAVGDRVAQTNNNVYQIVTGVRGDVGLTEDITYDVYMTYGRADILETQYGNISRSAAQSLLDAPDGGASLCDGGFDPFGQTTLSADCLAYVGRTTKNSTAIEQRIAEATMQGKLFQGWAGDVRFALGTGYREENFDFLPDAILSTGDVAGFNAQDPLAGTVRAQEFFGEFLVPLLSELPLVEELSVNLAYRYSDYNTVGGVSSWNVSGDWRVGGGFRFRGGYGVAVRAPSIGELFAPENQNFPSIGEPEDEDGNAQFAGDPCDVRSAYRDPALNPNAAQVRQLCLDQGVPIAIIDTYQFAFDQVQSVTGGNPDLEEETADTWSVGFVWSPVFDLSLIERLSFSVDYYSIQIENVISAVTADLSTSKCYNVGPTFNNAAYDVNNVFCQMFSRDPATGNIVLPMEKNQNLAARNTSGVDFQIDWGLDLGSDAQYGAVAFNVIGSWLEKWEEQPLPGDPFDDRTDTIGQDIGQGYPEWKFLTSANWTHGDYGLGVRWRYVDEMDNFSADETLPAIHYFDVNAQWDIVEWLTLRASVNNVTDEPPNTYTSSVQANTDPSTYDVLGRRWTIGFTGRW